MRPGRLCVKALSDEVWVESLSYKAWMDEGRSQ